jgi:DNA-binding winged helix-turn-helix (wHTH) protein
MNPTTAPTPVVRFGVFEADLHTGELRKQGLKIKLTGQPMEVLAMLLEHPGELVTREEIQKRLWPGETFVDFEHSLNTTVKKLREALGDDADNRRFVETLPRRGYRFIAPVETPNHAAPTQPSPAVSVPAPSRPPSGSFTRRIVTAIVRGLMEEHRKRMRWRYLALVGLVLGVGAATLVLLYALNVAGLRDRVTAFVGARHGVPLPKIESIAVLPLENSPATLSRNISPTA